MAVDRTKVLAAAQKHLSRGNYDRAIAEYQKLVDADPRDVRTLLKIGDLYTRKGAHREATQTYERVAEHYATQGFFLKAVAVFKQILKLQPGRLDISLRLAEMYENLQLVSDALSTYETVAAAYARDGNVDKALETLGKMAALDPDNIPIRIKYAEALSKAGKTEEAALEFEAGAELLREQGRMDDYLKVAERLLYHRPEDLALARELAEHYLQRADAKRALAKLQLCFKREPKNVETLELLARAFHVLGQTPKTISVYRELARILQEQGRSEDRARILKKILELDPNDAEARQALAGYAPSTARKPPPRAVDSLPPGALVESHAGAMPEDDEPELEIIEEDIDEDDDAEVLIVDEEVDLDDELLEPVEEPARPSIPPDVAREAQIARLLTECDVFARYGLRAKVIAQLEEVLTIAPEHIEARERLKDAYLEEGRNHDAAAQLQALAELVQPQLAALYRRQAEELLGAAAPAEPAAPEFEVEVATEPPLVIDEGEEGDDDILFAEVDESEPPAAPREPSTPVGTDLGPGAAEPPRPEDEAILFVDDEEQAQDDILFVEGEEQAQDDILFVDEEEAEATVFVTADESLLEPGEDEAVLFVEEPSEDTTTGVVPGFPAGTAQSGAEVATPVPPPQAPMSALDQPVSPEDFEAAPVETAPGHVEEARARLSVPPGEIEETLDEADFFLAQGLHEAARATIADALESHPEHPLLLDKLAEIEEQARQAASQAPPAPDAEPEDESFALAEKLAEELGEEEVGELTGSDVLDVETVFEQFKKGVEEQIGLEDTDTHFDLGIAYKEMGLLDDAIQEFELAMKNSQRECICQTMIGLCLAEQGKYVDAIGHFKKGLYADSKTEREELGLYFELGRAYQQLDDPKEALYYFEKVAKREPGFRDVQRHIEELTRPQTSPAAPEPLVLDDVDSAFDELLDD